jgi:thioredoxin-like negative regulator of GroEL
VRLSVRPALLALYLLVGLVLPGCGGPTRALTLDSALAQARKTNQVVLVQFWDASRECWRMDRILEDPLVRRDLEDFVIVRMNYDLNRGTAENLGVTGAPGFASLRPDGSLIAASSGLLDSERFRQFLVRARIFR